MARWITYRQDTDRYERGSKVSVWKNTTQIWRWRRVKSVPVWQDDLQECVVPFCSGYLMWSYAFPVLLEGISTVIPHQLEHVDSIPLGGVMQDAPTILS